MNNLSLLDAMLGDEQVWPDIVMDANESINKHSVLIVAAHKSDARRSTVHQNFKIPTDFEIFILFEDISCSAELSKLKILRQNPG